MIYYALHYSGQRGPDYSHIIKAKNDRGAKQAFRLRSRRWISGVWVLNAPIDSRALRGSVKVLAAISVD